MLWAHATAAVLAGCLAAGTAEAADASCARGIKNLEGTACCPVTCTRCGGAACDTLPGGVAACCTSGVLATNRQCSTYDAPCIIGTAVVATTATPTAAVVTAKPTAAPSTVPTTERPTTAKPTPVFTVAPTSAKPTPTPPTAGQTTGELIDAMPKPTSLPTATPTAVPSAAPTTATPTSTPTSTPTAVPVTPQPTIGAPDPTCARGKLNPAGSICCPADVCSTQCGGDSTTCKAQLGGFYNCCLNGVYSLNRLCSAFAAPCTMPATAAPTTAKPTPKPTARPTTARPTSTPTAAPTTAAPTTAQPTSTPTATPTTATPTAEPTATPTSTPTAAPTTSRPTSMPTAAPTTASPTSIPTAAPTTAAPTTATPTAQPSATPTAVPTTRKPTPVPTVLVIGDPTCSRGTKNLESTVCCLTIACGGKCGGTGCETLAGGYYNCCAAGVLELGRQCSATEAPCALVAAPTPTPTAVTPVVTAAPTTAKPSALPTAAPTVAVVTAKPTVAVLTAAPTATPTTVRVTAAPSVASTGDPTCALGVLNAGKNVCCPKDLCSGQCGGTGCADLPGGSANCCSTTVVAAAKSCAMYKAPCVMPPTPAPTPAPTGPQIPDPYCLSGIAHPNGSQCCNNGCIYCGQANCGYDPLGASNCCAAGIINTGRSCDTTSAPCTLDPTPVFEVDYSKIRRSTTVGVLPGPAKNYYQRETAYKVDLDSILMYMPVQRVVYSWVQGYLNKGVQVQLVIEFVDSTANLAMVAAGKYDIYLYSLAKAAVADGRTISIRPLHEFNGDWYPWGIFVPGNTLADYKAAYKHVVDLFRSMNAPFRYQQSYNVANANSDPTKFVDFYAGDDYVDQICVSAYNMVGVRYSKNKSFAEIFGYAYAQLTSFTRKPLCLAEMSTTSYGGDKPQWITNTWSSLAYQFTAVTTVNWFFENKTDPNVDWDLNTQADVSAWVTGLSAFRNSTRPA